MSSSAQRVPPHSIEAEQSVLGSMLLDANAVTQAMETLTGYRVVIDLPFESAGIRDLKKAKFNAYRLDKKADGKLLLYALNPTMCESFHRPAYFVELNEH